MMHVGIPPTLVAVGAVVAVACIVLFTGTDRKDKQLRERVASVREVKTKEIDPTGDVVMEETRSTDIVGRALRLLGYRPDHPDAFAAKLALVLPISAAVGLFVAKLFSIVLPTLPALAVGCVGALGAAALQFRRKNAAYRKALFRQIPDALSLMLRAVRAGLPVPEAVKNVSSESLSPTREEFGRVAAETALGMQIDLALRRLYERTGLQEYAFFAVVIGLNGQTGGNLAETIENLADTVRRRVAMAGKAKALAAEGRLSAMLVGALPFGVGGLTVVVNPDYMQEFLKPAGQKLIVAFAVLLTIGLALTHWLVQRSTQD